MTVHNGFYVGGLYIGVWLDAFNHCSTNDGVSIKLNHWPNGLPYIEQDNIAVEMFTVIREEVSKMMAGGARNGR